MAKLSKFIDTSKCTACRGCQTACKSWNQLPAEILEFKGNLQTHTNTSPITFTYVTMEEKVEQGKIDWYFAKRGCMHCTDAACEKACPKGAISHTDYGAVIRDKDKCIGCGYCANYCPFGIPKVNKEEDKMYKCHLCSDRVSYNLKPACAKTCATGAIQFGDRTQLASTAKARLKEIKKQYPDANLYGIDEEFLGGTNVFYLLLKKPEFYGLPTKPNIPTALSLVKDVIQPLGKFSIGGAAAAVVASFFISRFKGNEHKDGQAKKGGANLGK